MNPATIGRRTYQVPGRFSELQPRQLTALVGLLHAGLPLVELRLRLLLLLLDVKRRPWLAFLMWFRVNDEQRYDLLRLTAFALREPKLYEQRLPVLHVGPWWRRRKLHGPAGSFANLSFAEYIDCEAHFAAYAKNRKVEALDKLVAAMYRPASLRSTDIGDVRQAYNPHSAARRVHLMAALPLATKLAVRMWYASCRQAWAKKYEGTLFAAPEEGQSVGSSDPRAVWNEVLAERAGSPDRYEVYGLQPLPNVFYDLDLRIRRRQKEQEELKNSRR